MPETSPLETATLKSSPRLRSIGRAAPIVLAAIACSGCVGLVDRAVSEDLKTLEQEFHVFQADAALFRSCLRARGGACQGDATTPLPHTSQAEAGHAAASTLVPGAALAAAMSGLPDTHPARSASAVLIHPVVRQATALHNHLRGLPADPTDGVTVEPDAGGSTIGLDLKLRQMGHFHDLLLGSIGVTAWESLSGECAALLARHRGAADFQALQSDCRTVAFIRGYLRAYFRGGEFIEVDVKLAGAIRAVDNGAAALTEKISALRGRISGVEGQLDNIQASELSALGAAGSDLGAELASLLGQIRTAVTQGFGSGAGDVLQELTGLGDDVTRQAAELARSAGAQSAGVIGPLVADLDAALKRIDQALGRLSVLVGTVDRRLVAAINDGLDRVDASLSNVFRVSHLGFVSRDLSFQARLPTLEVTFDPTAKRLLSVTDADTGQLITKHTALEELGVVDDRSGVGSGASIGAEAIRVFLEALFDAHEGLPAVAPVSPAPKATGLTLGDYSLPLYSSPMGNVDAGDLSDMTHVNDSVAAATRIISGRIVSGLGPLSLNNRPLEDLIVEIITTSVRKAAEKASWCWYACNLDQDLKALARDAAATASNEAEALSKRFHEQAERVKLRLKLSR